MHDKGLITILLCSAVFSLLSLPPIFRWVPRKPGYGHRTRATLSDDELRHKANSYFGVRFLVATVLSACTAVALHAWQGLSPRACL